MLAIIIPYYKLTFFEETLQSLAMQSDRRFKVYIGDDASPENPVDLLEKYKGEFEFIYHRFESNLGGISLTKQWERCIALSADEEWIMILGDDDVLGENVVEEFYRFMRLNKSKNIDLIRFNLKIINEFGNVREEYFNYNDWESSDRLLERMFSLNETITASEFVFNRHVYNLNNGFVEFPLAWFSDYATWLLYARKSGVYNLSKAKIFWRLSGENISAYSVNKEDLNLKVTSLFLFIVFLNENFVIKKEQSKEYILNNLGWYFNERRFYTILMILKKHIVSYKLKYFTVIFLFVFKKMQERL
ncbi:MAG: glycosyltransferase [Bacteroidota bacterium]